MNVQNGLKSLGRFIVKNKTTIFIVGGVTGLIGAGWLFSNERIKAIDKINRIKQDRIDNWLDDSYIPTLQDVYISPTEKIKAVIPIYIPSLLLGGASIALILAAHSEELKKRVAAEVALRFSESKFKDFRDESYKLFTDDQRKEFNKRYSEKRLERHDGPFEEDVRVEIDKAAQVRCLDIWTGREFMSSADDLEAAINRFNAKLLKDGVGTLNDFYDELLLDYTDCGYSQGWNVETKNDLLELYFTPKLSSNNTPILAFKFSEEPSDISYE